MIDLHEKIFDKNHLKQSFDSAAVTYESHSVLQRYTADEILDRLKVMNINPQANDGSRVRHRACSIQVM